jgi:hypothetical protein
MREQGAFGALQDVASYIEDGTNNNGLTIWLRLKKAVSRLRPPFFDSLVAYDFLGSTTPPSAFSFQIKIKIKIYVSKGCIFSLSWCILIQYNKIKPVRRRRGFHSPSF